MLAMDASDSLAKSKKFSTHVEEPAFGTFTMAVKIIGWRCLVFKLGVI